MAEQEVARCEFTVRLAGYAASLRVARHSVRGLKRGDQSKKREDVARRRAATVSYCTETHLRCSDVAARLHEMERGRKDRGHTADVAGA